MDLKRIMSETQNKQNFYDFVTTSSCLEHQSQGMHYAQINLLIILMVLYTCAVCYAFDWSF